jgi:hypothetical protein
LVADQHPEAVAFVERPADVAKVIRFDQFTVRSLDEEQSDPPLASGASLTGAAARSRRRTSDRLIGQ